MYYKSVQKKLQNFSKNHFVFNEKGFYQIAGTTMMLWLFK